MFSTPASSFHSSENQGTTARKMVPMKVLQRKPFLDRPVNNTTPVTNKLSKGESSLKQNNILKPKQLTEELDAHEYVFSFKDKEDIDCDVWPKPSLLGTDGIVQILRNYCNSDYTTPPPSPLNENINLMFENITYDTKFHNEGEDIIFEDIDEIDIPQFDDCVLCL